MKRFAYTTLQQRVWRWHFFAGLMVVPFAIILASTGAIYLFKPQFESYIENSINAKSLADRKQQPIAADNLLAQTLVKFPGSQFRSLTLAKENDPTIEFELRSEAGTKIVWVDRYSGEVLHQTLKDKRLMNFVQDIHGNLLVGKYGSFLVELMASWMIVLLISGVFIWWPRSAERQGSQHSAVSRMMRPPGKTETGRSFWFRLHGVTGFWIFSFVLILLLSGLPWTQVWGNGFKQVQSLLGWDGPGQEWSVTLSSSGAAIMNDEHAEHQDHSASAELWEINPQDELEVSLQSKHATAGATDISLQALLEKTTALALPPPAILYPPKGEDGVWTLRSMIQNRPLRSTHHFDRWTGEELMQVNFSDYHPVKKLVSYGLAVHEGQLFGWFNQLLGLLSALGVVLLSASGAYIWWKRKPSASLGAPKLPKHRGLSAGLVVTIIALAAFLPMLAFSLAFILAIELIRFFVLRSSSNTLAETQQAD